MNKIVASVGLAALGVSSFQVGAQEISSPQSRIWSVSASLRGFYDSNINTTPNNEIDSFGISLSPGVFLNWTGGPTTIKAGYLFNANYFDERPAGNTDNWDFTHTFNGSIDHAFNERYQISVVDSFAIGQEPDTLRPTPTSPLSA